MGMVIMSALLSLLLVPSTALSDWPSKPVVSLQNQHPELSPAQLLKQLAADCHHLGISTWDRYGDFGSYSTSTEATTSSWLRRFEHEIASEFGKQDAVFMPSGVMAQSIALLIHRDHRRLNNPSQKHDERAKFACHSSSHLLLHEQDGYKELLQMDPIVIDSDIHEQSFSKPMSFDNVKHALNERLLQQALECNNLPTTLILEVPHRELGGKCTPWDDVCRMSDYCKSMGIAFHCDGARIFEASVAFKDLSLAQLAVPFDSIYVSFYKGLGGMSGAMLLGSTEFCEQARVWLRRFGGNLYTLLPYAASSLSGYRRHWRGERRNNEDLSTSLMSFKDQRTMLRTVVATLQADDVINAVVTFDPPIPATNMVHGYFKHSIDRCQQALAHVKEETGIEVLRRLRPVPAAHPAVRAGFCCYFEWAIGEANGFIPKEMFVRGWASFAKELSKKL